MSGQLISQEKLPFYYVVVVWGEEYVDMLLNITLPCLLSPGNLPGLSNLPESRFLILSTPEDGNRIAESSIFRLLKSVITPVFVDSPWIDYSIPYHLKAARGHRVAAEIAAENSAYCIYLAPDFLLSDGSLRSLEDVARSGKRAVMIPGIRLVKETLLAELDQMSLIQSGMPITLSSRALVSLSLRHLHIENQRYNWNHPYFSAAPVVCTWDIPEERGLLVRAFHLHPIMVSMVGTKDLSFLETNTIDGEFLGHNIPDWNSIHVETDSDNIVMFSLTKMDDRNQPMKLNTPMIENLRGLAYSTLVNPLHRYYFTKAIKLHTDDLSEKWSVVEEETGRLVYLVLEHKLDQASLLAYISGWLLLGELRHRIELRLRRMIKLIMDIRFWRRMIKLIIVQALNKTKNIFMKKTTRLELPPNVMHRLAILQKKTKSDSYVSVVIDAIRLYERACEKQPDVDKCQNSSQATSAHQVVPGSAQKNNIDATDFHVES